MSRPGPPDVEPTWLAGLERPAMQGAELLLARERIAASIFPEGREGTRVGRYLVLERVGTGGMGVVYAAYDPELDRKVAIKILHTFHGEAQESLLREARALARLSHPHVVSVHDVGTFELADEPVMFVAMEFIAGTTLTQWAQGRSQRDVLDLMLEAGRGLAAAHAVGIVHRDFKPDNVLVDRDGHAHVVDFGLARAVVDAAPSVPDAAPAIAGKSLLAGTPGYMSPEQLNGLITDARTDQFSFCVTLWEALYGERPFEGKSLPELVANVFDGRRRVPPKGITVPGWLRAAIERGLAFDAADRWPTLEALLDALQRGRSRARRYRLLGALGFVALSCAGLLGARSLAEQRRIAACEDMGAEIDAVWNDEQRDAVRVGFLATSEGRGATTVDKLMPWLDAHAQAWKSARTEACLDAEVRGTWDESMHARAQWCFDARRMELAALVTELREPDDGTAAAAVQAAAGLRQIDPCRDRVLLERAPTPPPDAAAEVEAIRADISRAKALESIGKYERGLTVARDAIERAEALDWPPLTATARVQAGTLLRFLGRYDEAETSLEAAYFEAATVGAEEEALVAALSLTRVVGYHLARYDAGERWAKLADVARARLPDPGGLRRAASLADRAHIELARGDHAKATQMQEQALAILEEALGRDHFAIAGHTDDLAAMRGQAGDFAAAARLHRRAFELHESALGPDHPVTVASLSNVAIMEFEAGKYVEAKAMFERTLAIYERTLGRDHPQVAMALGNVSIVLRTMGSHAEAMALDERALRIMERTLGPDHPDLATLLYNMAAAHNEMGEHAEAKALFERALRIWQTSLGPEHADVARALIGVAAAQTFQGEYDAAHELLERAVAIAEKTLGPEHTELALALNNLGVLRAKMGAHEEAIAIHHRALQIRESALGEQHPDVALSLHNLASSRFALGQLAIAEELDRRALAIWEATPGLDPVDAAQAQVGLARIALAQRRYEEARALTERAREAHRKSGAARSPELAEVEAWLQQHE